MKIIILILLPFYLLAQESKESISSTTSEATIKTDTVVEKEEVLENPTLKTLSGSLRSWSLYSAFTYKGGSLDNVTSAERPNITEASENASLQSFSGNLGIKYRLTEKDNFSLQVGMYMAAPLHSSHTSSNRRTQQEFDNNHQEMDIDDPKLSYFRTYYLGEVQNVTFLSLEKTTKGVSTDFGYYGNMALSQASAFRILDELYIAGTFYFAQYMFDKDSTTVRNREFSLKPYQTERVYKLSLSTEYYAMKNLSIRFITDVAAYYQMRDKDADDLDRRALLQTLAMTYFFNRDISIAPSLNFIADDIRSDRTNVGVSMNINI